MIHILYTFLLSIAETSLSQQENKKIIALSNLGAIAENQQNRHL
jgi:hypothetical protein